MILLDDCRHILDDEGAVVEYRHPVAEPHDQLDVMLDEQDGRAVAADALDQVAQFTHYRMMRDDNYIDALELDLIAFERLVSENEAALRNFKEAA